MSRTALTYTEAIVNNVIVLDLDGKIMGDQDTKGLCRRIKEIEEKGSKNIVLNFRKVKWINSLGLGSIMGCLTTLRTKGGDLRIANVHEAAMKCFTITRLDTVIKIYGTLEGAVNSYS